MKTFINRLKAANQLEKEQEMTPEQVLFDIKKHQENVAAFMVKCAEELLRRAEQHDRSKLGPEELPILQRVLPEIAKSNNEFGTPAYKENTKKLGPMIVHHNAHNDHHFEHFPNGILGMDLFMLMEAVCDWLDAINRNPGGDIMKSIAIQTKNHGLDPQVKALLENTARFLLK